GNETRVPTRRADRIASRPQPPRRGNLDQPGGEATLRCLTSPRGPWRRQERARVGVAPAHLYRPFQGRTVEDADRRANGACLPVPAGTRFCECGAVVIHNSHELGKLHRHRTQATQPSSRESSQERSGAALAAIGSGDGIGGGGVRCVSNPKAGRGFREKRGGEQKSK
ncbi:hypothetical protein MRX96_051268, partial [Rhipicephalus microplus]